MSLYHEAAEILTSARTHGGSLKSLVFGQKTWKSDPKALFALTTETAKWSVVLSEVLQKSGVLTVEKNVSAPQAEN
jgi:putative methyltransferase